ncbi:hypothetical protein [Streptomyces sp. NBC_01465]|uniref:hypothetical protein n=1 Tax=Streptomyces sp. NBC_01465 TaxID=2903878 RepID=UPI002E35AF9B|nr:hypothetical protein [Streptomyces sp. NBC_01465]
MTSESLTPPEPGTLVLDTATDRVGIVMGSEGPYLQLRPPGGGREWDAAPASVRAASATDTLRARVGELNADRRRGI